MAWQITRRGDALLELSGELRMADASAIWQRLRALALPLTRARPLTGAAAPPAGDSPPAGDALAGAAAPPAGLLPAGAAAPPAEGAPPDAPAGPRLDLDLGRATAIDGAVMALLVELRDRLAARGVRCELLHAPARLQPIVHLYRGDEPWLPRAVHRRPGAVARLGRATSAALARLREAIGFAGDLAASAAAILRRPLSANWRALPGLVERAGTDGLPIVLLLNFLLGFVMAFQTMHWLELYGANVYVADVVGISVTRELAPLMTAIIMSGRSGAAFAAELGTMRVSEEIDALRTMGFAPVPHLVIPRVAALALAAPILTLVGDVVGVLGGLAVGVVSLDLTPAGYVAELRAALVTTDVWTGLAKSVAFGSAIALVGCHQGLATRGSAAAAVGRATTATVVRCLFAIVLLDTLFTVLFRVVRA